MTPAGTEDVVTLALSVAFGLMAFCLLITSIMVLVYFVYIRRKWKNRKRKHKDFNQHNSRKCEETENEIKNLLEIDGKPNDEPNVPLHERGYISEQSSASINYIKDASNTEIYALYSACKNGKTDACEYFINRYPDMLNQVDDEGWNAAFYTAKGGNVKILKLLAEKGVDMTYKTKDDGNILHIACVNSRLEMCQHIIQQYPDMLKQVNNYGSNGAFYAAQGGNVEILELLAEKGVDMTYTNKNGSNILHIACGYAKSEMCQYTIQHYPDMLKQVDNDGSNGAFYAAQGGNVKILELLAEKGVDMTYKNKEGCNILHIACSYAKSEMCQHIIQHYPDTLQQVSNEGLNAALYAAQGGNVEILELLAQKGVDMTYKHKNGSNILHIACMNFKLEMCKHIIQHYPDMLNQVNDNGCNVAFYAAQGGNVEILELLAEKGVDMTYKNKEGCNILHIACAYSKSEMCQHIIQHYPDMLQQVDNDGCNAALYAAKEGGNVAILELLTEKCVDMRYKTNDGGNILHIACGNSRLEMCQYIIQHYPDMLQQVNNNGLNAALYVARGGNVEILELLVEKGVDMTYKNKDGSNILHIACAYDKSEMCHNIIQHYPDMLKQVNNNGCNAALCAVQGGNVEILELLAEKCVDLTYKSKIGSNILHIACANSRLEMCQYIIQHYPDMLQQVDNDGWNAALCAAQGGNVKILELLAGKGVDMTYKSKEGCNILDIACINSRLEMCQYIIKHFPDMLKQVNDYARNAILCAAQRGNVEILELFAENGVNMTY
ncbi:putative ankyrin repeat protein RF_0381 [Saccostrea cucullata]|uniref:putative ankyrin repeat protein RF_0381 n=1 Tax=Saccostrea cuccullata TaxID=36930 RepID=UPI002ED2C84F